MTTKERILHELDQLDEEELEILYQLIEQFLTARQQETTEPGFLERLAKIQIDGPVDFASEQFWLAASQLWSPFGITRPMMSIPSYSRHDVVLIRYPFSDLSGGKVRLEAMRDDEIDLSDIPELTEEQLQAMRPTAELIPALKKQPKQP